MNHTLESLMALAAAYSDHSACDGAVQEARAALQTALSEVLAERDEQREAANILASLNDKMRVNHKAGVHGLRAERDAYKVRVDVLLHAIDRKDALLRQALEALEGYYGHKTSDGVNRTRAIVAIYAELGEATP